MILALVCGIVGVYLTIFTVAAIAGYVLVVLGVVAAVVAWPFLALASLGRWFLALAKG